MICLNVLSGPTMVKLLTEVAQPEKMEIFAFLVKEVLQSLQSDPVKKMMQLFEEDARYSCVADVMRRTARMYQCFAHLLLVPDVQAAPDSVMFYVGYRQSGPPLERFIKQLLTADEPSSTATDVRVETRALWKRLASEVIRTSATSMQLEPMFQDVKEKISAGRAALDFAAFAEASEAVPKLKAGMRAAVVEQVAESLAEFANALVSHHVEQQSCSMSTAQLHLLQATLRACQDKAGCSDALARLGTWSASMTKVMAARDLVDFCDAASKQSDEVDTEKLKDALRKCSIDMPADAKAKLQGLMNRLHTELVDAVFCLPHVQIGALRKSSKISQTQHPSVIISAHWSRITRLL